MTVEVCTTTGKLCYRNPRLAEVAAKWNRRRRNWPNSVYKCPHCWEYHVRSLTVEEMVGRKINRKELSGHG